MRHDTLSLVAALDTFVLRPFADVALLTVRRMDVALRSRLHVDMAPLIKLHAGMQPLLRLHVGAVRRLMLHQAVLLRLTLHPGVVRRLMLEPGEALLLRMLTDVVLRMIRPVVEHSVTRLIMLLRMAYLIALLPSAHLIFKR